MGPNIKSGSPQKQSMIDINTQSATIDNVPQSMDPDDVKTREAINECIAGMNGVKKGDIVELKALSSPPAQVIMVMSAVNVALGH